MSNLKKIYEKFNLTIDDKMYGDGSLSYRYDEDNELQNTLAELIPYATVDDLPNIRMQPAEDWKSSAIWPKIETEPADILYTLLYTMIVKVSAHIYNIGFKSRRAVYSFSLEKEDKKLNFWLIHENAPFDNDPTFWACKRVQEIETGRVFTYGYEMIDADILEDMKLHNI